MPRKLPERRAAPRKHISLSRPNGTFVPHLPTYAEIMVQRTPWERICDSLVKAWGDEHWFHLKQDYAGAGSAVNSARVTFEKGSYPEGAAEALQVAVIPAESEGRVQVFLRLDPEMLEVEEAEEAEFDG